MHFNKDPNLELNNLGRNRNITLIKRLGGFTQQDATQQGWFNLLETLSSLEEPRPVFEAAGLRVLQT